MEYQLDVQHLPYLRQLHTQPQTREETQELRIGDGLGNIGRVLCAWGQVVLRGKQWQPDGVGVQGGVMVWVLYAPEDGGPAQCVEDWIPLSVKWPAEQSEGDGKLFTTWLLRGVDARTVDLRRLMVRVTVDVYAACFVPDRLPVYSPKELPKDILLLEKKRGKTIVISTHILEVVEALADRVGVIIDGQSVAQGTMDDIIMCAGAKDLREAFISLYEKYHEEEEMIEEKKTKKKFGFLC